MKRDVKNHQFNSSKERYRENYLIKISEWHKSLFKSCVLFLILSFDSNVQH